MGRLRGRLNQTDRVQDTQGWRNLVGKGNEHQLTLSQPGRGEGGGAENW